jgi:excisionase family DNA binding protein
LAIGYDSVVAERFFTAEEVAERLRLDKVTVLRWIKAGRLPAIKFEGTSGYRIRGTDVEDLLWTEYGGMQGYLRRAARALYDAADAAASYSERFDDHRIRARSSELRRDADRLLREAESFLDLQGFYRRATPQGLQELQPLMAAPATYNSGNQEFQTLAVMVRDASAGLLSTSMQVARIWIDKAERTNAPNTEHGRLVRLAGPLLLEHLGNKA